MSRRHINLLVDFGPTYEYGRQIIIGANRFCRERPGYRLRTATSETNLLADAEVIDGVIAVIESPDPHHRSTRFGKPLVNVSTIRHPVPFPTVSIDSRLIGRAAAEHLLGAGYRSFGYHMESQVYFSRERFAGFKQTLAEAGYECAVFDSSNRGDGSSALLYTETIRWLSELPKPLGLFTHNDQRASVLIDLCHDAGLNVPDEVGVIGVDNDPLLAEMCTPTMTSIDTGAAMVGYLAAEMLMRLIQGEPVGANPVFIPPRSVVARASTQPSQLTDPRLAAAVRYIRDNAMLSISVDDVIEVAGCSRRSLERLFSTHLGHSPAQEIRRVQINHAKWLLLESDRSLAQIAERCGYPYFRNFATAFNREVGMSASAYRKKFAR